MERPVSTIHRILPLTNKLDGPCKSWCQWTNLRLPILQRIETTSIKFCTYGIELHLDFGYLMIKIKLFYYLNICIISLKLISFLYSFQRICILYLKWKCQNRDLDQSYKIRLLSELWFRNFFCKTIKHTVLFSKCEFYFIFSR